MIQTALDLREQGQVDALRTAMHELRCAQQGIERLKHYLAVCHADIDRLEAENSTLQRLARESRFNAGRVKMLEAEITQLWAEKVKPEGPRP